ncbi:enoyl-CoA hydratase/isomerase family protein [Vampirovibrio chlorellavorus]|uniref:enoyl-CoA hydratase/isomerase family protein n=1 Tax=Vampirovibrio chlorellavorus TaxID=758823 RepID=UPI0026E97B7C|nr:enoyl-CoA hydratase/isomerase family protein [Vampirovibrio chlorellavorus]
MGDFIRIAVEEKASGAIATVTLGRPELHNAFNAPMIAELRDAFTGFGKNSPVRAIVLRGEGKSFCAGADLNWMRQMVDYSFEQNVEDAHALAAMFRAIQQCPKPVIARVHGAAFGGGVGLVAACDMAFATASASFCLSEVKLGLLPAVISPFVLKKIGEAHARRYFLTAEKFSATEAHRIGLLSEALPDEAALDNQLETVLAALCANGPEALAHSKILIEQVCRFDWERAVDITTKLIAERRISAEGQEGMQAFLEKRSPTWVQVGEKVN